MSHSSTFSESAVTELREALQHLQSSKIYRRIQALYWKSLNKSHTEIASLLGVTPDTITDWVRLYTTKGLIGLSTLSYDGRRPSKLDIYQKQIQAQVEKEDISTIGVLQAWIASTFGISVEASWLSRYCKKNSILLTKKRDSFPANPQQKTSRKP